MTKLTLTLLAMTMFGFSQAQSFKIGAGYGLPWITQQIGTNSSTTSTTTLDPATNTEISRTVYTSKVIKGSYGAGWNINGAYLYEFSKNLNLELGLSYMTGRKYTTQASYTDIALDVVKSSSYESEASKSTAFLFTPTLKFLAYDRRRPVTPYFFAGPVLSKVNFSRELKRSAEENGNTFNENSTTKFSGGISVGFRGGVGVSVVMSKKMSFFSEVVFTGMNYLPKESEITRYTINGEDNLSNLTENVRRTIYVNEIETDSQQTTNEVNAPGRSLRFPVAMSSISANVGVIIKPK